MLFNSRGLKFYKDLISYNYAKTFSTVRNKHIDKSFVPVLNEKDLEERCVRGSGPGGQSVNKTMNCVQLTHIPTGLMVKVHLSRLLQDNRKLAREILTTKLDNLINGEKSVENQKKALDLQKRKTREAKRKKLQELRENWKKGQAENSDEKTSS